MTVAHDSVGGSGSWNTATEETWTHSPSGTPKGVAVLIAQNGNGDQVSGVTYGGVAMRRVWYEQRTATETCATYLYVLESGVPTGNQTVGVTSTGTLVKAARSVAVTADGDVMLAALERNTGLAANPSLAVDALVACVLYYVNASGLNTPVSTPESGTTQITTQDLGSISAHWGRKDSDGSSTTIGWTSSSDDFSHIAFGFREAVGPQAVPFKSVYNTTTSPKDVVVPDCLDGDLLLVHAIGDNGTSGDSVTAVTTSTQAGSTGSWTEHQEGIGTVGQVWAHGATAEVTADGSVTVRLTRTMTGTARIFGFTVWRIRDHGGIGNSTLTADGSAEVGNLAVSADSFVAASNGDWDAAAVATAWVPADGIINHRVAEGDITVHVAYWLGQTSGTRDYGSSGSSSTSFRVLVTEILAAGGGSEVTLTPATMAFSAPALTITPTAVLTPAVLALSAPALSPSSGPTEVTLTPAVLSFSAVEVDPTPVVELTPAVLAFSAVAVSAASGPTEVTLTPAVLALSAVAVTAASGPTEVTLTPAVLAFGAVALSFGALASEVTLTPATIAFSAVAVSTAVGVTLTPAVLAFSAPAVTASPGPTEVTLTPATLVFTPVALVLTPVVTLAPAVLAFSAPTLTFTPAVTLTPAVLTFVAVPPTYGGAANVTLAPAVLVLVAVPVAAERPPLDPFDPASGVFHDPFDSVAAGSHFDPFDPVGGASFDPFGTG